MANIIVLGAGLGGLTTSMLLALDGHDVTVVERDPGEPPSDPEVAWQSWERRGVNQFRMLHAMLPRWCQTVGRELPEVVRHLVDVGGIRYNLMSVLPDALTGGYREGDEQYDVVTGRRPTLECAVSAAAAATYGIRIRRGVGIAGLLTGSSQVGGIPHVVGLRTTAGDDLYADLVVDAGGRRSTLPAWIEAIGGRAPVEDAEDSGFVYYGRHFRSSDGWMPDVRTPLLVPFDSVSVLTLPCDNGTWGVGFVASAQDRELRRMKDPDRWDAALARYPHAAHWGHGEPITGVDVMAKIEDRRRRFVVDGEPVVTGVVAVGDAWACTNPSLGRGTSIGIMHGCALRDLLREVTSDDAYKLAQRWDDVTESVVGRLYEQTLAFDRNRLAEIEADCRGEAYVSADPAWPVTKALGRAAMRDPDLLRAYYRIIGIISRPDEVLAEPGVFERVIEVGGDSLDYPLPGPNRAELLATIGVSAAA